MHLLQDDEQLYSEQYEENATWFEQNKARVFVRGDVSAKEILWLTQRHASILGPVAIELVRGVALLAA
jgi:hypothetical protein